MTRLQKVEKEMEVVDIWCELKYRTKLQRCKNDHTYMTVPLHRSWLRGEMIRVRLSLWRGGHIEALGCIHLLPALLANISTL